MLNRYDYKFAAKDGLNNEFTKTSYYDNDFLLLVLYRDFKKNYFPPGSSGLTAFLFAVTKRLSITGYLSEK